MAWLRFRVPGRALPGDELLRRLGRRGAAPDLLRRADPRALAEGRFEPGGAWGRGALPAGSAVCASLRPVRIFRPPPAVTLRLLVPRVPWPALEFPGWALQRVASRGDLDELEARPLEDVPGTSAENLVDELLDGLRELRATVLGDVRRGGILVEGGLRVRPASAPPAEHWWPEEPAFPPEAAPLQVSKETLRALGKGHPWVLADRQLGDLGAFPSGHRVRLRGAGGAEGGEARVDGEGQLAARLWAGEGATASSAAERTAHAVARRADFLSAHDAENGSEAYRLIHGEADGLPGLAVDRLGDVLRVCVQGRAGLGVHDEVVQTLDAGLAGLPAGLPRLEVVLLRSPQAVRTTGVTWEAKNGGAWPTGPWRVREHGLSYQLESGLAEPRRPRPGVGLFLDQRANRQWVRARADGGVFANLFAHTGSFSAALLAGGAREVWSVDLSAPYLDVLEANLLDSGLDASRHHRVQGDARRFLEQTNEGPRFDGIIIDPPTAAAAGRRYWSVRSDLRPLLSEAMRRLRPGGWLLVSRNERQPRDTLREMAAAAAEDAGCGLKTLEDAPPAKDFPRVVGFPEGDAFEGICLRIAG